MRPGICEKEIENAWFRFRPCFDPYFFYGFWESWGKQKDKERKEKKSEANHKDKTFTGNIIDGIARRDLDDWTLEIQTPAIKKKKKKRRDQSRKTLRSEAISLSHKVKKRRLCSIQ